MVVAGRILFQGSEDSEKRNEASPRLITQCLLPMVIRHVKKKEVHANAVSTDMDSDFKLSE